MHEPEEGTWSIEDGERGREEGLTTCPQLPRDVAGPVLSTPPTSVSLPVHVSGPFQAFLAVVSHLTQEQGTNDPTTTCPSEQAQRGPPLLLTCPDTSRCPESSF